MGWSAPALLVPSFPLARLSVPIGPCCAFVAGGDGVVGVPGVVGPMSARWRSPVGSGAGPGRGCAGVGAPGTAPGSALPGDAGAALVPGLPGDALPPEPAPPVWAEAAPEPTTMANVMAASLLGILAAPDLFLANVRRACWFPLANPAR